MKNRNQAGVLLLEFGCYFFLTAFVAMSLAVFVVSFHRSVKSIEARTSHLLTRLFAFDLLHKDVRNAPQKKDGWKKIQERELIWHSGMHDSGWCVDKGKLYRVTGVYDASSQSWVSRTKNMVYAHAHEVTFTPEYAHGLLKGFVVHDQCSSTEGMYRYIAMRGCDA